MEYTDPELQKVWSSLGLNPQLFPQYYDLGPVQFVNSAGQPSGAAGARATLSRSLSNPPHMLFGLRIQNVYDMPPTPNATSIAQYEAMKKWVDGEQTIRITLAQQNPTTQGVLQTLITGHEGVNWHPFPVPFPMAGANDILVEVTRVSTYPGYATEQDAPTPRVFATLVCGVFMRGPAGSMGVVRRERP